MGIDTFRTSRKTEIWSIAEFFRTRRLHTAPATTRVPVVVVMFFSGRAYSSFIAVHNTLIRVGTPLRGSRIPTTSRVSLWGRARIRSITTTTTTTRVLHKAANRRRGIACAHLEIEQHPTSGRTIPTTFYRIRCCNENTARTRTTYSGVRVVAVVVIIIISARIV